MSLDPDDWPTFRQEAHQLLDHLIDQLRTAGDGPVWRPVPEPVKARLASPSPAEPQALAAIRAELAELILPYGTGNTHPRFFGWVHGSGTPGGMLAEMAAAALNANCGGRDHGAIYVERAVLDWAKSWFGWPREAGGLLVGGTSMANLLGLAVARHHALGPSVRSDGLAGRRLVGYASSEAHLSLSKAFELLGLGSNSLRPVPIDERFRMKLPALAAMIEADRAAGLLPFAVIATVGTVNSGAIDPLPEIAELCRSEGIWLHVDGAFGALVVLDDGLAPLAEGIEKADSLAFDFHKWLHVPYDAGCLLVKEASRQLAAFSGRPDYLASAGGLAGGEPWPCDLGIELSRGFRALKVWFTVKEQGTRRLGRAIVENCAQARHLAARIAASPHLELAAPVALNIVCCRFASPDLAPEAADRLNGAIITEMQLSGLAVPSSCRIGGRLAIRFCITNHRSREADFDLVASAIEEIGLRLSARG